MQEQHETLIFGLRPVLEALQSGKEFEKIFIQTNLQSPVARELQRELRDKDVFFQYVPLEKLNRITRKNHQGVVAYLSEITYRHLDDLLPELFEKGKTPLLIVLDEITDGRNLGAIVRTVECAGADGVVVPQKGSALINADIMRASAGALNILPVCREKNMISVLQFLKSSGLQTVACTEKASETYSSVNFTLPTVIVLGSEGRGMSPELLRGCEMQVRIPLFGKIGSLNVSVAAGIMLYEAVRQRTINK
jgi:23S rRNA (guanosine2251-2'-O)-methyltransferase